MLGPGTTCRLAGWLVVLAAGGCSMFGPDYAGDAPGLGPPGTVTFPNPLLVPVVDRDFFWDELVDVVDDYFRIEREQRVRLVGDVLTEGRIDTFPETGATLLEPHRHDSVGYYNRLESTLQTIRRFAHVRAIPTEGGYLVEVVVNKELEDRARPDRTTSGAAVFRTGTVSPHGGADVDEVLQEAVSEELAARGWITLGRDAALEQLILARIGHRMKLIAPFAH